MVPGDILSSMKLTFTYDRDRDIWCVLNYGKTSTNSPTPTKVYEELVRQYGEQVSKSDIGTFIESYLSSRATDINSIVEQFQSKWDSVSSEYEKRAEEVFGIVLPNDTTAYLTINNRCPYNIEKNMFFVSAYGPSPTKTVMHELWHFYTWFKYGVEWEEKLGKAKYNEIKEAFTVLLNVECKELLPEGLTDRGYSQHQELRQRILDIWSKDRNMDNLWQALVV